MITTLVIVALLLVTGAAIYYFEFYKKVKLMIEMEIISLMK